MKLAQKTLDAGKSIRDANEGVPDSEFGEKIEKQIEEYVPASVEKKVRSKAPKEKKYLDFEASLNLLLQDLNLNLLLEVEVVPEVVLEVLPEAVLEVVLEVVPKVTNPLLPLLLLLLLPKLTWLMTISSHLYKTILIGVCN